MKDTIYLGNVNLADTFGIPHKLYNPNNFGIKLIGVSKNCFCIKAFIKDSIIQPQGYGYLYLEYIPAESGQKGQVNQFVSFRTNIENESIQTIYLNAYVK
jgi:hypothetical protein